MPALATTSTASQTTAATTTGSTNPSPVPLPDTELMFQRLQQVGLQQRPPPDNDSSAQAARDATTNEPSPPPPRRASVLVPLFCRHAEDSAEPQELYMLLTVRSPRLRTYAGQVCFPGGQQDPEDGGDDVVTALRETREEVGLADDVQPLGRLPSLMSATGLVVTPIVGRVRRPLPSLAPLTLCPDEVELALAVPVSFFANDANIASQTRVEWRGGRLFELRTYQYYSEECQRTFEISNLTAYIAYQVSKIAMGEPVLEGFT